MAHGGIGFRQNEFLVMIEKIFSGSMEEMEKMFQKAEAIENCDFRSAGFVVKFRSVFVAFIRNLFRCDENIIVDSAVMSQLLI